MNDRELLELAAKAAGVDVENAEWHEDGYYWMPLGTRYWNPFVNDGDALRLAVELKLSMDLFDDIIAVGYTTHNGIVDQVVEPPGTDPYAATRRAIVRAAAEIGKEMK